MEANPKILSALRQLHVFQKFSLEDLTRLAEFASFRKIRTGETIFCQGEPSPYCFGVLSGEVTLFHVAPATTSPPEILSVYKPGQLFGEFSLLGEMPRPGMASVSKDGELLSLWSIRFRESVENNRSVSGDPSVLASIRLALQSMPR